jgi:hypothetical protein
MPPLRTALAYEVIFQKPIRDLFAGVYEIVEKKVELRRRLLAVKRDKKSQSSATRRTSGRLPATRPSEEV